MIKANETKVTDVKRWRRKVWERIIDVLNIQKFNMLEGYI